MASVNKMESSGRQPIPPAKRRRLQQCFEHGSKNSSQGNFDYATDMFTQCVIGDPANPIYTKSFLDNLFRKYENNKKGSRMASLSGAGVTASIKKASFSKDWEGVIKSGLEMLKLNPWHVSTCTAMAQACEELHFDECQLLYLKAALDANPKDIEVNRICGKALGRQGHFDQAIACYARVQQAKPGDEEANKAIGDLHVNKTMSHGGYDDASTTVDVRGDKANKLSKGDSQVVEPSLTPEQRLERAIAKAPAETNNYIELAELHTRNDKFAEAEALLAKALQVSGGDVNIRERLEDIQLRRGRQQLLIAERKAQAEKTEEAVALYNKMKAECNRVELEVYRSRSERYPTKLDYKFELGLRLKKAGQFKEAIECLQAARGDTKRRSAVHLELGECFQHIKMYELAMDNYTAAIEHVGERDPEQRKLALYRAGVLAMGIKDLDKAKKLLTELAGLEFGYKDVAERLDKIGKLRNK